jgi:hypothetical protein
MAAGGNGLGQPGETPAQQIPMHKFPCMREGCGTEVTGRAPMPQIFNAATVSGIVFSHERVTRCPKCSTPYICVIGGITAESQLQMTWIPLQTQQAPRVTPPTAEELKALSGRRM